MEQQYYIIIGVVIGLIALIVYYDYRSRKCKICGQKTRDVLVVDGKVNGTYCRNHLMEKFRSGFLSYSRPMIVFHPEIDRRYCETMYPFYTLSDLKRYNFTSKAIEWTKEALIRIGGDCNHCRRQAATVAYFPKGILPWENDFPMMERVNYSPELLCADCTINKISPSLKGNKKDFIDNGLFVPYGESGVYLNTAL